MTTRRGFLGAILAAGVAPAAVGSGVLMPVREIARPRTAIWQPAPYVTTTGLRLAIGDVITVAGIHRPDGGLRQFRVNATSSGFITLQVG